MRGITGNPLGDKIMYKMWNRQLGSYSPNIEVIFYDKHYNRLGKIHCAKWYAKLLPGEWKSPIAIYYATNGTMGLCNS